MKRAKRRVLCHDRRRWGDGRTCLQQSPNNLDCCDPCMRRRFGSRSGVPAGTPTHECRHPRRTMDGGCQDCGDPSF